MGAGLNPCSNGIWSLTGRWEDVRFTRVRLNPCSNGIWSLTEHTEFGSTDVLSLNPCSNGIWSLTRRAFYARPRRVGVLILVLMEYGL